VDSFAVFVIFFRGPALTGAQHKVEKPRNPPVCTGNQIENRLHLFPQRCAKVGSIGLYVLRLIKLVTNTQSRSPAPNAANLSA